MAELVDKLQKKRHEAIKERVQGILKLPLEDREALPHTEFLKITAEALDLFKQWKELDNPK